MKERGSLFHDLRSSMNGVICMGSLLEETVLTDEQAELLKYMLLSAEKTLGLIDEFQKNTVNTKTGRSTLSSGTIPEGNSAEAVEAAESGMEIKSAVPAGKPSDK